MFGLVQGGIVPIYALIVRECYTPSEAGSRVGLVLSSTLAGMAIGGWMSGAILDATLSYRVAFLNGFAWTISECLAAMTWQVHVYGSASAELTAWCADHDVPLHVFD